MALIGPVRVVGAGLLGTSIALALRERSIDVLLRDVSEENIAIAIGLGAGRADDGSRPQLVVIAVPPDHLATEIAAALTSTSAAVTDVGSVKAAPLQAVRALVDGDELMRYVGGHPMAGSERSGPFAGSATLFDGRPWAVVAHDRADAAAIALVAELVDVCGATAVTFTPDEHDSAVARTSHLPHLLAALVAGRLADAPAEHLALSGQGVRDVTRIAAGDPDLWQQIIGSNTGALTTLLEAVRTDVDSLIGALRDGDRSTIVGLLHRGVAGTTAIPSKHGGPARVDAALFVAVPDHPGELARLFSDAGEIGVNIEDIRIDHDPARPSGLVELTIAADSVEHLRASLGARGWATHR